MHLFKSIVASWCRFTYRALQSHLRRNANSCGMCRTLMSFLLSTLWDSNLLHNEAYFRTMSDLNIAHERRTQILRSSYQTILHVVIPFSFTLLAQSHAMGSYVYFPFSNFTVCCKFILLVLMPESPRYQHEKKKKTIVSSKPVWQFSKSVLTKCLQDFLLTIDNIHAQLFQCHAPKKYDM